MSGYYLKLALHNLRRSPWLTALIVVAVALGIASSMTVYSILHAMSGDPIPEKSARLFTPQIDSLGPENRHNGEPPTLLSYKDVMAFKQAKQGVRQAAMFEVGATVTTDEPGSVPLLLNGVATHADFFPMFDVPFRSGAAWSAADEESRANVVVLTASAAGKLFPGVNALGRTLHLEDLDYRVVGVTSDWAPSPRFYVLGFRGGGAYGPAAELFIPFQTAAERGIYTSGPLTCTKYLGQGAGALLTSECIWTQYWVELPDAAAERHFRDYLSAYAAEQQRSGRFSWPPLTRLHDVTGWLAYNEVTPTELRVATWVAFGFLLVCLVNAEALMMARSTRRATEFSLRRALGAPRSALFAQGLWESLAIGATGGLVGIGLTLAGLQLMRRLVPVAIVRTTDVDPIILVLTLLLSVGVTVCAGMYPAWRSSRFAGPLQLKAQ